jgi:hypothetical protein
MKSQSPVRGGHEPEWGGSATGKKIYDLFPENYVK